MSRTERQIHSLSDEEVSRWIAEKLEPIDSLPQPKDGEDEPYYSPKECWHREQEDIEYTFRTEQWSVGPWQFRDMVNDAQMTVMLLEKLLDSWQDILLQKRDGRITIGRTGERSQSSGLGRAVAEAFMLANGYKEC